MGADDRGSLEQNILMIIRDSAQPMGCGAISHLLQKQGFSISEATVGRLLREMDNQGHTEKAGFQGRLLSEKGTARLTQLENQQKGRQWGEEFASILNGHSKEQLLEVLVARRAIESELAYLAAVNRTKAEASALNEVLERQRMALAAGSGAAQEDVDFHAIICLMARNRVLEAAVSLIRQDTQLSPVLEYIRRHVKSLVYIDHQKVAEAIAKGQADNAREGMTEHINNLIRDVEKYWKLSDIQKESAL
jgi:GntR family transcriptional regulator, transcriptional repressor for pyruvate dehydrogenase complex